MKNRAYIVFICVIFLLNKM
ncbi:MAG TPA: hypothetical protein ENK52_01270 [Saprospiraceae bacterium]|nr:hypothetical protein [Saprospiraceae bacterium]